VTSAARHRAAPGTVPGALSALTDLVLPRSCGGCGRPGATWCRGCAQALAGAPVRRRLDDGLVVWSAARYDDPVRSAVVRWKDRGRADLSRPLAVGLRRAATQALHAAAASGDAVGLGGSDEHWPDTRSGQAVGWDGGAEAWAAGSSGAAEAWVAGSSGATEPWAAGSWDAAALDQTAPADPTARTVLVPVPSSRRSRRARGHDPVRDLARAAASGLRRQGLPVVVLPVLRQSRRVADQAGLGSGERRRNLAGALGVRAGWRSRLDGRLVLLVDDVVTTGSTLREAQRVLAGVGARVLGAATVASTPLHGPHGK
jgi:predicted amidophosphoribosyltransferase